MSFLDRIRNLGAPESKEDADLLQIRQLAGMGADLARPRHVVHVLDFEEEPSARAAAASIERGGYSAIVEPPGGQGETWSVRAESERVISPSTVSAFRQWFERIAAEHGGVYDGWEASRKP